MSNVVYTIKSNPYLALMGGFIAAISFGLVRLADALQNIL